MTKNKNQLVKAGKFYVKPTVDTVYPASIGKIDSLEWQLRHQITQIEKADKLLLASILHAYKHLINDCTTKDRSRICNSIKRLSRQQKYINVVG